MGTIITVTIVAIVLILLALSSIFLVRQQTAVIIERLGRFNRVAESGLRFRIPLIETIANRANLRIQQLDLTVETKTEDNVFVSVQVAVQFSIIESRVTDAYYKLAQPVQQIQAYVFDAIRGSVPNMTLDDSFKNKDEIATSVRSNLEAEMSDYGYLINNVLVTDINPDANVKTAMNEINAAQRKRVAAQDLAEADKIRIVKEAESEAESKRLQGVGIAQQRKAIIDGLNESVRDFSKGNGVSEREAINLVLITQYFDTLATLGKDGATTILTNGSPSGLSDIRTQIQEAILSSRTPEQKP